MRMNLSEAGIPSYFVADTDKRRLYDWKLPKSHSRVRRLTYFNTLANYYVSHCFHALLSIASSSQELLQALFTCHFNKQKI
jgi:hypothetical protein